MILCTLYCFIYIIYLCCLRIFETVPPIIGPLRLNIKNNPKFIHYTSALYMFYLNFYFNAFPSHSRHCLQILLEFLICFLDFSCYICNIFNNKHEY